MQWLFLKVMVHLKEVAHKLPAQMAWAVSLDSGLTCCCFGAADKRDWYAGIRKWLTIQPPIFEYDYKWQPH